MQDKTALWPWLAVQDVQQRPPGLEAMNARGQVPLRRQPPLPNKNFLLLFQRGRLCFEDMVLGTPFRFLAPDSCLLSPFSRLLPLKYPFIQPYLPNCAWDRLDPFNQLCLPILAAARDIPGMQAKGWNDQPWIFAG